MVARSTSSFIWIQLVEFEKYSYFWAVWKNRLFDGFWEQDETENVSPLIGFFGNIAPASDLAS